MEPFIDFDKCELIKNRAYGGAAGRKLAVLHDGEPWILKFPESMRNFPGKDKPNNHLPPYTTSPTSEYIGSRVYASLGIPVHEVKLGKRDGKVVVACKDFAVDVQLIDFASIKNTVIEEALEYGNSSSRDGEYLAEALRVIDAANSFDEMRDAVLERFWDMFVVDAFILNNDRNNGNWGLLAGRFSSTLAPVFDNGNAFFNKKGTSLIEAQLNDKTAIWNDIRTSVSFYKNDDGKKIHPFDFMAAGGNQDCNSALKRFVERVDLPSLLTIVDNIPEDALDMPVITTDQKRYYKTLLELSYSQGIEPAAKQQGLMG